MSPFRWFQRLFSAEPDSDDQEGVHGMNEDSPFIFTQHFRIVLAIAVCVISAFVIWWILV